MIHMGNGFAAPNQIRGGRWRRVPVFGCIRVFQELATVRPHAERSWKRSSAKIRDQACNAIGADESRADRKPC